MARADAVIATTAKAWSTAAQTSQRPHDDEEDPNTSNNPTVNDILARNDGGLIGVDGTAVLNSY